MIIVRAQIIIFNYYSGQNEYYTDGSLDAYIYLAVIGK